MTLSVYDFAAVGQALDGEQHFQILAIIIQTDDLKDQPDHPDIKLASLDCQKHGVWDAWINVLTHRGWTKLPTRPSRLTWGDLVYRGAWRMPEQVVYQHLNNADIASNPATGDIAVYHKGGVEYLDLLADPVIDPNPLALPICRGFGVRVTGDEIRTATPNRGTAGTFGGMEFDHAGERLWLAYWSFYNVGGKDEPGLVSMSADLSQPDIKGAWRAGPSGVNVPLTNAFHQNVTQQWVCRLPGNFGSTVFPHMGSGRRRGGNQAFGGRNGPALFGWLPDEDIPPGGDFDADLLLVYPGTTWAPGIRYAENDERCNGTCITTADGRSAVIFGWTKGRMTVAQAQAIDNSGLQGHANGPNWYGAPPHKCSQNKGWHANPYDPVVYLYDLDDLDNAAQPWHPQPFEEAYVGELYRTPDEAGVDPNCGPPFFVGMTWDHYNDRLLVMQSKSYDPGGGSQWRLGCILHEWGLR